MVLKYINLKQSKIKAKFESCFKKNSTDNMKKTGLYGYVYDFSVHYDRIGVDDILDILDILMVRNNIK